jgi:dienelactone hydrolase
MSGRIVVVLALVLGGACRRSTPPPPLVLDDPSAPEIETREVQLDDDFITARLHIPPTDEPRKPTVISMLGERQSLLAAGFLVVTYRVNWEVRNAPAPPPTPSEHTVGKAILASPSEDVLGQVYLRSLATTADDVIPKIIDWLVTVPEIDPARLAIVGSSSNGFITLMAAARDRRLVVAVALAACGDYHLFLRDSSLGMAGAPLALDPGYDRWLRTQEIVRHPSRLLHAAVLMVNRNGDPIIPFSCAERTADVLTRAYRRAGVPHRFRFTAFESDQHGLDARDGEETTAWLRRWLQTSRTGGRATRSAR